MKATWTLCSKENDDARDGIREGEQGIRGGADARREDSHRHGELQRAAGQGWRDEDGRGTSSVVEGQASALLGCRPDRDRRAVRRDEGAHRRLLAVGSEIDGRGGRVAETGTVRR